MKKLIYISGILSANLMMFGSFFKMYRLPMATDLLLSAVLLFCFFFLPAALISAYQSQEKRKYKVLCIATFVVFFTGIIAILFKIEHWPEGNFLLPVSLPLPFILLLPVYFYETRKENKSNGSFLAMMLGLTFLAVFSVLLSVH